jgi:hypothetical protein
MCKSASEIGTRNSPLYKLSWRVLKILLTGVKGKAEYGGDVTVYQVIGIHSTYPDDGGRRKT